MKEFIRALRNSFDVKEQGNGYLLTTPIMYKFADHRFSFHIEKDGCGFVINDMGQTFDYMEENFDPDKYTVLIEKVCSRFEIILKDKVFYGKLASYESNQTMRNLTAFIGAMNTIANIDVFDESL